MAVPTEADVAQKMSEPLVRQHAPEIQASGYGALLTRIPTIDDVLNEHATALRARLHRVSEPRVSRS